MSITDRSQSPERESAQSDEPEPSSPKQPKTDPNPAEGGTRIENSRNSALPDGHSHKNNNEQVNGSAQSGWLARLFSSRKPVAASLRDDLADALAEGSLNSHVFSDEEKTMLNSILRLQDLRVEDLMVPRADIEAVEINTTLGELLKQFESSGHSRMPVYGDTLDDPRGMVHIRDVVAFITKTAALSKSEVSARKRSAASDLDLRKVKLDKSLGALKLIRKVLFVPPSMLASDLMARMQATRIQMALVIDEYGGTDGIVSLEDIVEVIVGDIEDEHDDDEQPLIEEIGQGVFIVDAKAELDNVVEIVGEQFQVGEHSEDVDTIGGLIFALIGRVPIRGEVIEGLGFEFSVVDADPRRIKRVQISPSKRKRTRRPNEP
ncbi:MAG: hemolysin family protein [Rhizobiaceae bacterium]